MKKLFYDETPPELIEAIKKYYFSKKQVINLTGLTEKQVSNLGGRNMLKADYYIQGKESYFSYHKLLELILMKKVSKTGNGVPFSTVKEASKVLKKYTNNRYHISDTRVFIHNKQLYFYDYLKDLVISLSGKNQRNFAIKGIFDLTEIEKELKEKAIKNFVSNYELKVNYDKDSANIAEKYSTVSNG